MFWFRNKKINLLLYTLIWGPAFNRILQFSKKNPVHLSEFQTSGMLWVQKNIYMQRLLIDKEIVMVCNELPL